MMVMISMDVDHISSADVSRLAEDLPECIDDTEEKDQWNEVVSIREWYRIGEVVFDKECDISDRNKRRCHHHEERQRKEHIIFFESDHLIEERFESITDRSPYEYEKWEKNDDVWLDEIGVE